MCGIAGIVDFEGRPASAEEIETMCSALVHRGPDEAGYRVAGPAALGMRRLRIIDLATGQQPVRNEDGTVWVVFNGEIYNFRELRAQLQSRGHAFYTSSDTEVIVHLYEELGSRCVEKLRGMFAFAVWDERRGDLLLARDRLGKKPLYYASTGGRLLFASEIKALLAIPSVERRIDWTAASNLFTFLSTPADRSIVEGIRKLPPASTLVVRRDGSQRVERYWECEFEPDYAHDERYFVERLRELLDEAVRLRLESDVPLGAFLSGGIDSSAVVASMARLQPGRVRTFSIGFDEPEYNELDHARQVAECFGTEHHERVLEPDALELLEDLAWYLDEPFGDPSAIPTYMVSALASEHVTVLLSGDGGDEIFAGYDKYVVERRERRFRYLPAAVQKGMGAVARWMPETMRGRNLLRHLSLEGPARYLDASTLFRAEEKRKLFRPEVFEHLAHYDPWQGAITWLQRGGDWLSALERFDLESYLPLDILTKVDRMSMAHSIEARAPLLDHKLVEFAATIPPELKLRGDTTKYIFKRAMRGILPDSIIDRRKHGFAVPLSRWFRGRLGGFVRDLLLSETSARRGIFNLDYVRRLIERHERGRELDLHLWTLISFELWCRTFLDGSRGRLPVRRTAVRRSA